MNYRCSPQPSLQQQPDSTTTGIRSVGIIGAGQMGRGIAEATVQSALDVTISDVSEAARNDAVASLREAVAGQPDASRPHFLPTSSASPQIHAADTTAELGQVDLVIETVKEKLEIKRAVFEELAPGLNQDTIVATNSSSIPLSRMADRLPWPDRFCGLHFCHPVRERPLVEVIRGEMTSDDTLARAVSYVNCLGKRPVVVKDNPGFIVNRLLLMYLNEALELLLEGAEANDIEEAAIAFGMPSGPLTQLDEFGIETALRTGTVLYLAFPDRVLASRLLIALFKSERHGQKQGEGFFASTNASGSASLAPETMELIDDYRTSEQQFTQQQITQRLFLPLLIEATLILEEEIVSHAGTIDVVMEDGLGFQSPEGSLFAWANNVGVATLLQWLEPLEALGKRFQPSDKLRQMARTDGRFLV